MHMYSLADGNALVKAARYTVDLHLKSPSFDRRVIERQIERYAERRAVVVTLEHHPTMSPRGFVGSSRSKRKVSVQIVDSAAEAAAGGGSFVPVSQSEMDDLVVGVNLLSDLVYIGKSAAARKKDIKLGRDGIYIEYGFKNALLLPNVAVDRRMTKEEFLYAACEKAGMAAGSWMRPDVGLYKFTAQMFKETNPDGEVREVRL